jgi:DNA mismatch repair protein MSH6
MSPVDRIFTRIGAHDHILAGESTFYVEMSETATILKHATGRSIALIDELGKPNSFFFTLIK